ncbi:MAG: ribosome recycling factor [Desulfomonilaceae bacterium]|nr:ribosome recycling factor [Syntrophaceae bacterium]
MIDEVHSELKSSMDKSVDALQKDLKRIRTGRASLALLDGIMVNYYGSPTPINQLATLSIPEPRQIVIQPWDSQAVPDIEKAILKSELGLTPMNDGKVVRINLPPLTAERRKELVKLVRKMGEEFKVQLRNHRRDANEMYKEMKKDKEISEDDLHKAQEKVQKTTDEYISKIDGVISQKESEIMEI